MLLIDIGGLNSLMNKIPILEINLSPFFINNLGLETFILWYCFKVSRLSLSMHYRNKNYYYQQILNH
jgi:hypothetical protein